MPPKLTPERAQEIAVARGFTPLTPYVGLRKNWLCRRNQCGHEFSAKYESIQQETQGCPICSGHTVLEGFNDLASKFPEIAAQADGQRKIAVAKADSAETIITASAKARAMDLTQQKLTPLYVEYKKIEKWDGQLPSTVAGGTGTFLNIK